jgi:hypothetical protein
MYPFIIIILKWMPWIEKYKISPSFSAFIDCIFVQIIQNRVVKVEAKHKIRKIGHT